ncbi:MAG: hypothetical protein NUV86_01630 [Candidatus Scalindua sp.]|nr:hypothetical protein [Candidatus Scalindua sp.]MCR4344725.1 hypothetical protein [Candidatus Scalindua sp.]
MGDLFKKLDEIMTGDLVRKVGGLVCLVAAILVGAGFIVGAKSVLNTMKGSGVTVEATDADVDVDDEATSEDAEEVDEENENENEDDYDE